MTTVKKLALDRLHRSLGATLAERSGYRAPAHYGDPQRERDALGRGCALLDGSACDRIELVGEDRVRFLNGMVTADVAGLAPSSSCYGLFADIKGRVLADVTVVALPDRLWLRVPPGTRSALRRHLERFIITDRVEVLPLDDMVPIIVAGPESRSVLGGWTEESLPGPQSHTRATVVGTEVCLLREERIGTLAWSMWVSASIVSPFVETLLETEDLAPVGYEAAEQLRIESGIPAFGAEIDPDTFPQEAGVDDAVSYEKGCYLGQEVIARIHFRGGVQRLTVQLDIDSADGLAPGAEVEFEGRGAGHITSLGTRSDGQGWTAMARLAKRADGPDAVVDLPNGSRARVRELPTIGRQTSSR